eukprot:gene5282-6122_t
MSSSRIDSFAIAHQHLDKPQLKKLMTKLMRTECMDCAAYHCSCGKLGAKSVVEDRRKDAVHQKWARLKILSKLFDNVESNMQKVDTFFDQLREFLDQEQGRVHNQLEKERVAIVDQMQSLKVDIDILSNFGLDMRHLSEGRFNVFNDAIKAEVPAEQAIKHAVSMCIKSVQSTHHSLSERTMETLIRQISVSKVSPYYDFTMTDYSTDPEILDTFKQYIREVFEADSEQSALNITENQANLDGYNKNTNQHVVLLAQPRCSASVYFQKGDLFSERLIITGGKTPAAERNPNGQDHKFDPTLNYMSIYRTQLRSHGGVLGRISVSTYDSELFASSPFKPTFNSTNCHYYPHPQLPRIYFFEKTFGFYYDLDTQELEIILYGDSPYGFIKYIPDRDTWSGLYDQLPGDIITITSPTYASRYMNSQSIITCCYQLTTALFRCNWAIFERRFN